MDNNNSTLLQDDQLPKADNTTLFGTSSTDIVEGLHANAFRGNAAEDIPRDDDQIVNEQDQQEIVNAPEEDDEKLTKEPEGSTLQNLPDVEKDLLDKNIFEEKEVPGEEDTNDIKAS